MGGETETKQISFTHYSYFLINMCVYNLIPIVNIYFSTLYYLCCINMNSLHLYCMNIKSASCSLFIVYRPVLTRVSLERQHCPSRGPENRWSVTGRRHNSGTGPQVWQACCVCTWYSPCTEGSAVRREESQKDK